MSTNYKGLTESEINESRVKYGRNILTPPPSTPWWKLYLEKFKDPIVMILVIAAVVSLAIGIAEGNYIEPVGIIIAIALATGIGFYMEYSAKKQFDILNKVSDNEPVKVIRNNEVTEIPKTELVVGDIVLLSTGDEIPADIELYESNELKVDESTMTGESIPVSKVAKMYGESYTGSGFAKYLVLRSTRVTEGNGLGIVVKVGDNTEIGKTTRQAMEETEVETPLNKQLNGLASLINKAAFTMAGLLLLFLNIHHFAFTEFSTDLMNIITTEVEFLMMAIVLIVVSVPEGLPMATTLSLAFSMKTMARENNLVKKMHACETIGAVNIICTDKTGTLTQNKMKVVDSEFVNVNKQDKCNYNYILNSAINSTAELGEGGKVIGNPTEGAILNSLADNGYRYQDIREDNIIINQKPFNSTDKYMSTTIANKNAKPVRGKLPDLVLVKGAPEVISKMTNNTDFMNNVSDQQSRGRRAISFASGPDMGNLVYDGTVFIEDPVRDDVPEAVSKCYTAGIDIIMMTGDNIKTATEIARQAGFTDIESIEAKDWNGVIRGHQGRRYPNVIARCKPEDKLRILKDLQNEGYVCAMTGDGVNDSPSLNHSDVGIAMGSGTSVAKEAADIVLLDDAFPSIVTGVKWGRSLYKNIQSFLTFQLIINVATCLVVLFSPLLGIDMPFTVTQMLWVNIVMDTLAALCLASEPADENVLNEKPRESNSFIITNNMTKTILGMGFVMFLLMSIVVFDISNESKWFGLDLTELFAGFMIINWWNLFNIRVFGKNRSIFHNISESKNFLLGSLVILLGTILIVQLGGEVFNTRPLSLSEWIILLIGTSPIVIIKEIYHKLYGKNLQK